MAGFVHAYIGEGKGKTTAAMGLALRCAGYEKKVLITQFLKDGSSGELSAFAAIECVEVFSFQKQLGFVWNMDEAQKKEAKESYHEYFSKILEKGKQEETYDLLILDEILGAIEVGFLEEDDVMDFLKNCPQNLEVVLTGRVLSKKLRGICDYVTNMQKEKHPFDEGIMARQGIEF